MKYEVIIQNIDVHCDAIDWAAEYPFKGNYNWVSSLDSPDRSAWGWVWKFSYQSDAVMFKLLFC